MLHLKNKKLISLIMVLLFTFNISGALINSTAVFINASGDAILTNIARNNEKNNEMSQLYLPDPVVRLRGLELSPGFVNKKFGDYQQDYNLTLSEDQTEFTIKPTARFPNSVTMHIIDPSGVLHPIGSEEISQAFQAPESNDVSLYKIKIKNNKTVDENIIDLRIFRVSTKFNVDINEIEKLPNGTKKIRVDAYISPEVDINTVSFALEFDKTKLQLANSKTNEPIELDASIYDTIDLYHIDRYGEIVWEDFAFVNGKKFGSELNTRGLIYGDFGISDSEVKGYRIMENNRKFMTIHFNVIDDSFTEDTIRLKIGEIIDGVRIGMYTKHGGPNTIPISNSYPSSNRNMFILTGLMYKLEKTVRQYDNGNIIVSPDKTDYAFGEKIKVTATADRGYKFTEWDKTKIPVNMLSAAMVADPEWHKKPNLELVMPKADTTLELRTRTSTGFVKFGEEYDASEATLDFTNTYAGEQVIIIGDPYEINPTFNGEPQTYRREFSPVEKQSQTILDNTKHNIETKVATNAKIIGTEKIFKALNNPVNETYTDKNFVLKSNGTNTKIWIDKTKELEYSDEEILSMQKTFDSNYTVIQNKFGNMYDTDKDGKLNILIYDIAGVNSQFNLNELSGVNGNKIDIIHLSSKINALKTSVSTLAENMAFQTQKISLLNTFETQIPTITKAKYESMMPKWIESGLSMMAMELTGTSPKDMIKLFNSSEKIRNGEVSLTQWEETKENYVLSYLFFSYITAHTNDDILKSFYKSYAPVIDIPNQIQINDAIKKNFIDVLKPFPLFDNINFKVLHENFRIATYINLKNGMYGFNNKKDFSMLMAPVSGANIFDGYENPIKSGSAMVVQTGADNIRTSLENKVSIIGATIPKKILTITQSVGGNIDINPSKTSFIKNENVVLTATPDRGYTFGHWLDANNNILAENPLSIVMNEDKTYKPVFNPITQHNISYKPDPNGNIIIRDSDGIELEQTANAVKIYAGEQITITAKGNSGYYFDGWSGDHIGTKDDFTITLTIDKDMHLIPAFRAGVIYDINYKITPTENASFSATIKDEMGNIIDTNPKKLIEGSLLHLGEISLEDNWNFVKWIVNGIEYLNKEVAIQITADTNITLEIIETEKVIIAEPQKMFYDGSMVITDIDGNSIEAGAEVYVGAELIYKAMPEPGYKFLRWHIKNTKDSYTAIDLTKNPLIIKAVKGQELIPIFTEITAIGDTDPVIGSIKITTAKAPNRELMRLENGQVTSERFDQLHTRYNLYLKSDDTDVKIAVGVYGLYSDVQMQINNDAPMQVTGKLVYAINSDTNTIKISVQGNAENGNIDKTTEYIINVIHIEKEKTPTINIEYTLVQDTDYKLNVNIRNVALSAAQFTLALPKGTKFLGIDGKAYDISISHSDFLTYILGDDVATDFKISNMYSTQTDADKDTLMILFEKKAQNIPEIYNGIPFSFNIRLPQDGKFLENTILNDNANQSIISDYRFAVEGLENIYFKEKTSANITIKVNSMNNRYNNFDINDKYDNNGFNIVLVSKDGSKIYKPTGATHEEPKNGRYTTEFMFMDVDEGTYELSINKYQHLKLIKEIEVGKIDSVLTDGYNPGYSLADANTFYLIPGDINDDNYINISDKNIVRENKYYAKAVSSFKDPKEKLEAIKRDINNDGYINITDYNLVMASFAYGKTTIIIK